MISVINYGLGNMLAFSNIYKKLNIPFKIVATSDELKDAEKIILPGVGSYDWAMRRLNNSGMTETLNYLVIERKVPVIGVCVGMQIMASRSEEGTLTGLGWIDAEVRKFNESASNPLPHMGWNKVTPIKNNPLFYKLESDARFYFLHSYYFFHKDEEQILAQTNYNGLFTSSANRENVYGVQFHPEKSHHWGVQLLKNFAERC